MTEVRGWHLGSAKQHNSIAEGYTPEVERRLLESVSWYENGYRLFEISVPIRAAVTGRVRESNCVFIHRSLYEQIGGYDERYQYPGGGFVNHDFFWRAATGADPVFTLLGEGTFHQTYGGAATDLRRGQGRRRTELDRWRAEYA